MKGLWQPNGTLRAGLLANVALIEKKRFSDEVVS
jgi:hypothetical protein